MTFVQRSRRLFATALGLSAALLALSALNLLYAAALFWSRHQIFWALFWTLSACGFMAHAAGTGLALSRGVAEPWMELVRPLLKLGAIALALAGAAWAVQTVVRWERTGDFEAYGVVIGLVMVLHGAIAFVWLSQPPRDPAVRPGSAA